MDEGRFDALTRAFGGERSRRDVLRSLTGVLALGAGIDEAVAKKKCVKSKNGRACNYNAQCCSNLCKSGGARRCAPCKTNTDCGAGAICNAGKCSAAGCRQNKECPGKLRCIRGLCKSDSGGADCDSDGDCGLNQACSDGQCATCPAGKTGCNGDCLNLSVCTGEHIHCNNSDACFCSRIADNNNSRFCALGLECGPPCGPDNSCPGGTRCVVTCCDGSGNAGLRCQPPC